MWLLAPSGLRDGQECGICRMAWCNGTMPLWGRGGRAETHWMGTDCLRYCDVAKVNKTKDMLGGGRDARLITINVTPSVCAENICQFPSAIWLVPERTGNTTRSWMVRVTARPNRPRKLPKSPLRKEPKTPTLDIVRDHHSRHFEMAPSVN